MYIDSGADISLVPLDFGSLLGLQAQRAEGALRGIGGEAVELVLRSVSMRLNRVVVRSKIAVALTNEVPYLLGRYDVFNLFRITFEERKQRVLFEKI